MKTALYVPLRAGFTMLEIVVVMSIMALLVGIGATSFMFMDEKDAFEEPAQRLTEMSKFALHASVLRHQGLIIAFDKEGFGILGSSDGPGTHYAVPGSMKTLILRQGARRWEKAEGHFWRFGEQGICEPIKIRFESLAGIRDLTFHPLTGMPVD